MIHDPGLLFTYSTFTQYLPRTLTGKKRCEKCEQYVSQNNNDQLQNLQAVTKFTATFFL